MPAAELVLDAAADSVPRARAMVASVLPDGSPDLIASAELVVTELVTNALLHGAPPITLRLTPGDGQLRVEVEDHGPALPLQPRRRLDAMTGRGLDLVRSLAADWGVEPCPEGKIVWAVVDGRDESEPAPALDARVLQPGSVRTARGDDEPRYPVSLGAVPTAFLLAAKTHIDNVVRELALMRSDEQSTGAAVAPALRALVTAVTEDFAEARTEIKRQAVAAAERGDEFCDLHLELPLAAAAAGERYLAALEEADRHARAAHLLTLAPPPSHRAFRRWYVQSLVDQLRAAAENRPAPTATSFQQALADEVDRLSSLEDSWAQLQLLQRLSADLTGAPTVTEIANTVVERAAAYPGVETARVFVLTPQRTMRSIAWVGRRGDGPDPYDEFSIDADLPGAVVARTREPIFMRSLAHIYEQFPVLEGYYPSERSLHIAPLTIGSRVLGLFAMTFLGVEVTSEAQVAFVRSIADVLAQAMDRAQASERAVAERGRDLQLLSAQVDVLTDIVGGRPLSEAMTSLLRAVESASPDGMLASVLLLDADGAHLRHCSAPSLPADYNAAIDGIEIGPSVGSCGTAAYRRQQVIVEDVQTDPLWADFRALAGAAGLRACWSTPIIATDGDLLGTFALYYPQPQRPSPDDLKLIDVLVRTVAMAIERSRADEEREQQLANERAAALTLQHSLLPVVPQAVGPVRLEARYRTGDPGVEVGGDWFDALEVPGGTVLVVGDVQGHDLRAAALMGQLRTVARASAAAGRSPGEVLNSLSRYLGLVNDELLTTALVVQLDVGTGDCRLASAGHLPPLVLRRGDDIQRAWVADDVQIEVGPPLGLGGEWPETTCTLPPDAFLLLYTDGLVETRTWSLEHGLMLLRKAMEGLPATADLTAVLDAALELVPTGSRGDDVAVLAALTPRGAGAAG